MKKKSQKPIKPIYTRWGKELDREHPHGEYPRPQLRRDNWLCLNGVWQYAICAAGVDAQPQEYDGEIVVPFSPESLLSGVGRQLLPGQSLWYRHTVLFEGIQAGQRILLHFGAVDQHCAVYLNGCEVGSHSGGYWPFCFDITEAVRAGDNVLTVAVTDESDAGEEAYGKQKLDRGGIWYTAQSGIWQTVWAEYVPDQYIRSVKITPHCGASEVEFALEMTQDSPEQPCLIQIYEKDRLIAECACKEPTARVRLEDFRYWSPEDPFLYDVKITAGDDRVQSYFAMREFGTVRDAQGHLRMALNGKPLFHTGLLDQGYWSDGLYTSPSDEAMVWEIRELKKLGFNMLRKHIKIEPLRWYYHCDRLGMLVWQDFVSGGGPYRPMVTIALPFVGRHIRDNRYGRFGRASAKGRAVFERDMHRTIGLLYNAPCIAVWVPFNEGWGQFDACQIAGEVHALDPTRLIDHASGWHDQRCGDFMSRHVYFKKFGLKLDPQGRIPALTEFGGYSCPQDGHMASEELFGYRMYQSREELNAAFEALYSDEIMPAVKDGLAAAIYTQVSDVEDEINGIFTYDRAVTKIDAGIAQSINDVLRKLGG